MFLRRFIISVLLGLLSAGGAGADEPVVRGTICTILVFGDYCLTARAAETYLRPGTRLELRPCRNSPEQIFDWNVISFEIKFSGLCVDAFRVGLGQTQAGDPIGLWYCNQTPRQKWFPSRKNESWIDTINIVGGGSPSSELCMSVAGDKRMDGAPLRIQDCNDRVNEWFRLHLCPPLDGPVS